MGRVSIINTTVSAYTRYEIEEILPKNIPSDLKITVTANSTVTENTKIYVDNIALVEMTELDGVKVAVFRGDQDFMAGDNAEEAPACWERMAAQSKGARPPEFLSTHPAPDTRIQDIKDLLPEAMKYYRQTQ